jgi:hypothetical protein
MKNYVNGLGQCAGSRGRDFVRLVIKNAMYLEIFDAKFWPNKDWPWAAAKCNCVNNYTSLRPEAKDEPVENSHSPSGSCTR